ncbi:T-cell-interacting, activating receptor on myeloid cells protein 1-like [Numida meleagris]|uniref:T-cell-interacting, activating receptor on myeloid cells protein 1-like n=1 Tax=Numida meleagris TaxID=8996 RepID=UPI000B3DF27F|nr:T-cell-interacting, activating receptor on myeloid cells protein 1-like [Numida meleagris]
MGSQFDILVGVWGTGSSSPATPCPHCCSLAVPTLILPHGTNGTGPHPGLVSGGSEQSSAPAPTLPVSLHPSQGVSLGDSVTLRCHLPLPAARVCVYQHKYLRFFKNMHKEEDTAEFSLVEVRQEDAMKYQCQYRGLAPPGTSEKSDPVALVVTGECTKESRWPRAVSPQSCVPSLSPLCT